MVLKVLTPVYWLRIGLFLLILYVSVNNFSVMSGRFPVILGWTSTKQKSLCFAKEHSAVPPVSLKPVTPRSQV